MVYLDSLGCVLDQERGETFDTHGGLETCGGVSRFSVTWKESRSENDV